MLSPTGSCRVRGGAKWPWVAATMRLEHNLSDAELIPPALDVDLDALWRRHTSVLRPPSARRRGLSLKIKASKFQADLYSMALSHGRAPEVDGVAGHFNDDPIAPGGSSGSGGGARGATCNGGLFPSQGRRGVKRQREAACGDDSPESGGADGARACFASAVIARGTSISVSRRNAHHSGVRVGEPHHRRGVASWPLSRIVPARSAIAAWRR